MSNLSRDKLLVENQKFQPKYNLELANMQWILGTNKQNQDGFHSSTIGNYPEHRAPEIIPSILLSLMFCDPKEKLHITSVPTSSALSPPSPCPSP